MRNLLFKSSPMARFILHHILLHIATTHLRPLVVPSKSVKLMLPIEPGIHRIFTGIVRKNSRPLQLPPTSSIFSRFILKISSLTITSFPTKIIGPCVCTWHENSRDIIRHKTGLLPLDLFANSRKRSVTFIVTRDLALWAKQSFSWYSLLCLSFSSSTSS